MIHLKITTEAVTDLFTPGVCGIHECTKGLPADVTLVDISFDSNNEMITYIFDDGRTSITNQTVSFTRPWRIQ